jgi:hypothetical protein
MSITEPTKKPRVNSWIGKGNQFLFHRRHPPCYSYIQSSPVKVLLSDRGKKTCIKNISHNFSLVDQLYFTHWFSYRKFISILPTGNTVQEIHKNFRRCRILFVFRFISVINWITAYYSQNSYLCIYYLWIFGEDSHYTRLINYPQISK